MIKHDALTQDVKTKAQELGSDIKDAAFTEAERAAAQVRDSAAEKMTSAASAADAAAGKFADDSLQARAAQQVADQVEGIAARLRTADLNTMTRDVSRFARDNPAVFIGGAALLGFAATRFLKARDPERAGHDTANSDPWNTRAAPTSASRGYDVPS